MAGQLPTYSGKDCNFALSLGALGITISAAGVSASGLQKATVSMNIDRTIMETGMDGAIAVSQVPGNWGVFRLDVWQTSQLQNQLLAWWNALIAAANNGDVSNWAATTVQISNIYDGSSHVGLGVAPMKVPDKGYGTQAVVVPWVLMAADITHTPGSAIGTTIAALSV